jgi:peptidoglycan lytic transglycosylase
MERPARARRAASGKARLMRAGALAFASAISLAACSGGRPPPPAYGVPTPLTTSSESAAAPADASAPDAGAPMSLEQFTPLLSEPLFATAAEALHSGHVAAAAQAVQELIAKSSPSAETRLRWQFLQARLLEHAGDLAGAAKAYDQAASASWPLQGYAWLSEGRVLLRQGQAKRALKALSRVPADQPIAATAELLIAEAANQTGDRDRAIDAWRHYLATDKSADRARVALELALALLDRAGAEDARDALELARRVDLEQTAPNTLQARARALEQRALAALPVAERAGLVKPEPKELLVRVHALLGAHQGADAEDAANQLLAELTKKQRWNDVGCRAALLRARAIAAERDWGRAAESLADPIRGCHDDELRAQALYLAGVDAAADGRHMQAIHRFEQLQKDLPKNHLADDARLREALSYYELGVEARFTALLSSMPDDYPNGDRVLDGLFHLALRCIEKKDWSGAASVLDRAARLAHGHDASRGSDFSGRERYFRARAWIEIGEKKQGEAELAAIVRELPLSYYMLEAYTHLMELDPKLARQARDAGMQRAQAQPFSFEHQPEFDTPGFVRAMELLRQGDVDLAEREITALGIAKPGELPQVLWGVALLYARAGSAELSHAVTASLLTDWPTRWPAGDWVKAWQLAFPEPYHHAVEQESKQTGVSESLIYAVMREESGFDPKAASPADAYGLMQLIIPTARRFARPLGLPYGRSALENPAVNIALGSHALAKLRRVFPLDPLLAIPAYNAGSGRPKRWLHDRPGMDFDVWVELIPLRETRRYMKRVLASRAAYALLYDPAGADNALQLPLKVSL